jgi:hypothetical protein
VRTKTPAEAVFLFQKPRALALYTGRRASAHHIPAHDDQLWAYLQGIGVTHIVIGNVFPQSHAYLKGFVERNGDRTSMVYRNADFTIYRLQEGVEGRLSAR